MPSRKEMKLANGIPVIARQIPGVKWQLCSFVIHSGAASDPETLPGLAHFVEHMVSANHSMETADIKNYFREKGGYVELGSTGFFSTSYGFKLPRDSESLRKGFAILKELLFGVRFSRNIERERAVIQSEYDTRFPVPELKALRDRIMSIIRQGTCVERRNRPLGEDWAIRAIGYEDLQKFYDTHYQVGNLTVLSVGALSPEEICEELTRSGFGELVARGERPGYGEVASFAPREETHIEYRLSDYLTFSGRKEISTYESHLVLPVTENFDAASLAARMLSKRMFERIREGLGLVYDVRAGIGHFKILMHFSIRAENFDAARLEELKGAIEDCIRSAGSDESLFEHMKASMTNQLGMLDITGARELEIAEDDLVYEGRIRELEEEIEALGKVAFADVQRIFSYLKPENRLTVVELP